MKICSGYLIVRVFRGNAGLYRFRRKCYYLIINSGFEASEEKTCLWIIKKK